MNKALMVICFIGMVAGIAFADATITIPTDKVTAIETAICGTYGNTEVQNNQQECAQFTLAWIRTMVTREVTAYQREQVIQDVITTYQQNAFVWDNSSS